VDKKVNSINLIALLLQGGFRFLRPFALMTGCIETLERM